MSVIRRCGWLEARLTTVVPVVAQDDGDDVVWALTTAFTLWSAGDVEHAARWVARAADSAAEAGRENRARELEGAVIAIVTQKAGPQMTSTGVRRKQPVSEPVAVPAPADLQDLEEELEIFCEESHAESPFPLVRAPSERPKPALGRETLPGFELPLGTRPERPLPSWIPADRVVGDYFVLAALGSGSAGDVLVVTPVERATQPGRPLFALKAPDFEAIADAGIDEEQASRQFRQEAAALLALPDHPNLARLISYDSRGRPKPFLLMELVEGVSCDELIDSGNLTMPRALDLLDGILEGLEAMHAVGVGHLDVKPGNVVVRDGVQPVLVDFGLSGRNLRHWFSTPGYGAPEVWAQHPQAKAACPLAADVYSAASFAYELITGRMLFEGPDAPSRIAAQLCEELPAPIDALARQGWVGLAYALAACLRRDPALRPTVRVLRDRLRSLRPILLRATWPLGAEHSEEAGPGSCELHPAGSEHFQDDRSAVG
jgi:hypothetical protein